MSHRIHQAETLLRRKDFPKDSIWFFDFDGVIASQCEEKVFRLEELPMERRRLCEMAELFGIDSTLYPSTQYLRHLVYQGAVAAQMPTRHKVIVDFLWKLHEAGEPYYIITARSGFWAVERLMKLVRTACPLPQEVFCLGRSSKAALLSELREDWPDRPFVYFEDSMHHIYACKALGDPDLHIVEVQWPSCTENAQRLRKDHLRVVV